MSEAKQLEWMREALRLAEEAARAGEVPVGAVLVRDGAVVGRGKNQTITRNDATAHAEVLAIREAGAALANHRLTGCEMYATLEPCAMCAGALVHARVAKLVYAAKDPKAGAAGSVLSVVNHPELNHRMEVESGLCEEEAAALLREFFRQRR